MTEEIRLVVSVDSTGVTKASAQLDQLTAASTRAEAATTKLATSSKAASTAQATAAAGTTRAEQALNAFGQTAAEVEAHHADLARQAVEWRQQMDAQVRTMASASNAALGYSAATKATMASQNAAMSATTAAMRAEAGMQTQTRNTAEALALMAQIDPVGGKLDKLDALEASLVRLHTVGAIAPEDFARLGQILSAQRANLTGVASDVDKVGKSALNARAQYSLFALATDAASGQFSRSKREVAALANESGLLAGLLSPVGLAITAVVVGTTLMSAVLLGGERELSGYTKALALTGNTAGLTSGALQDMARQVAATAGTTQHSAAAILQQVVGTGQFSGQMVQTVASAAAVMEKLGQDTNTTVGQFTKLAQDPTAAAAKLNESLHFLTLAQFDQISALQQTGQTEQAASVAENALASAAAQRAQTVQDSYGVLENVARGVGAVFKGMWDDILDVGRPQTLQEKIASEAETLRSLQSQLQRESGGGLLNIALRNHTQSQIASTSKQLGIDQLTAEMQKDAREFWGQQAQTQAAGVAGEQTLNTAYAQSSPQAAFNATIAVQYPAYQAAMKAATGNTVKQAQLTDQYSAVVAKAAQTLNSAITPKRTRKGPHSSLDSMLQDMQQQAAGVSAGGGPIGDYASTAAKAVDLFQKDRAAGISDTKAQADFDQIMALAETKLEQSLAQRKQQEQDIAQQYALQLQLKQQQYDLQVRAVGMGDKEAQREQAILQIQQQGAQDVQRLQQQKNQRGADIQGIDEEIAQRNQLTQQQVQMAKNSYQALDDAQSNWLNGFTSSLANLQDQSANVAGQVNGLFTDAFSGMGDAIANFATTGKLNFADLANSIISDLARMETRILMSQALSSILGAFATGPSGANMGYFGSFSQSATDSTASSIVGSILNAKGGVYNSPSLSRYSSGVYDTPHYFAFANGGVFGEAGPEAVMPLTRTSDGKLGVKSAGGSNVVVNITNQGQPVQAKQTGTRQQGNTTIVDMVLTAVATDVTQGGKTAQAMQQRFGLQRRGVPMGA